MSLSSLMFWIAHTIGILLKTLSQYAAMFSDKFLAISDNGQDFSEDERARLIAQYESEKAALQGKIDQLRGPKEEEPNVEKEKVRQVSPSTVAPKQPKAQSNIKSKKHNVDDDVLSSEQIKEMSQSIAQLDGPRLERVIQIIHEGVPEIKNSTEGIEIEIDQLPTHVLKEIYDVVQQNIPSSARAGRNR